MRPRDLLRRAVLRRVLLRLEALLRPRDFALRRVLLDLRFRLRDWPDSDMAMAIA
ncbi:MAG TPA: hypothetical protein VJ747_01480 [Stellaceae bacterium]|nr:hypothetical protein [Stellaceae bacterium]